MNTVMIKGLEYDRTMLLQMMGAVFQMTIEPSERAARHVISRIVYQNGNILSQFVARAVELRNDGADYSNIDMENPIDIVCLALVTARIRCGPSPHKELPAVAFNLFAKLIATVEPIMGLGPQQMADQSREAFDQYLKEDSDKVAADLLKKVSGPGGSRGGAGS